MDREKKIVSASLKGIGMNLFLVIFKAVFGFLANSISIILDALNNFSDMISAIITIIGAKLSNKAPDKKHPFGHGRIEYFSAVIISIIVLAALSVIPFIIFGIIYFARRNKLSKNKILPDGILTAAIIAFNLILVNFAIDFLFEIDFSNTITLLSALIIPVIYYVNLVLFFAFRYWLAPRKFFNNK